MRSFKSVMKEVLDEVDRAEDLFPDFPSDVVHAVGIVVEEAGESMQAALQLTYECGNREDLRVELIQTAAMVVRCLMTFDNLEPRQSPPTFAEAAKELNDAWLDLVDSIFKALHVRGALEWINKLISKTTKEG